MRYIAIDFVVALPKCPSNGTRWQLPGFDEFDELLTVSCPTSKRTLLIPGNGHYTAREWAELLIRELLACDWGIPKGIVSDRDRKFVSKLWQGIWKALGTRLKMTTAYHPQADGLSERKNQTVELAIRFHLFEAPDTPWIDILTPLQWNLNHSHTDTIDSTPHEQLYGFKPLGPREALTKISDVSFDEVKAIRTDLRADAKLAMDFAAAKAKERYDGKHRHVQLNSGDQVYLRLHHGYHLPHRPSRSYSQQFSGPFTIKRRVGRLAYELEGLPPTSKIHPVVSIAHLKPGPGDDPFQRMPPPPGPIEEDKDEGDLYEYDTILKHRLNRQKDGFEYFVKWKGYPIHEGTWEGENQFRDAMGWLYEYWQGQGGRPQLPKRHKNKNKKRIVDNDSDHHGQAATPRSSRASPPRWHR